MGFSRQMELQTIQKMLAIYCRDVHGQPGGLCPQCQQLYEYAVKRMDKCVYGKDKPVCSQCAVHCYKPEMRSKIKEVMRYSGPRMLRESPLLAIRYLYRKKFKKPPAI